MSEYDWDDIGYVDVCVVGLWCCLGLCYLLYLFWCEFGCEYE